MAIVVGSLARSDHPADEWSDLDVGFSAIDPQRYLTSYDWLSEIDDVWVVYPDPTGVTRHVLFAGGVDAGIAPIPHNTVKLAVRFVPWLRRAPLRFFVPGFLRRPIERELASAAEYVGLGVRIVLDKDGLASKFLALLPALPPRAGPTEQEYVNTVNQFWFEAVWTAKHIRRGELWRAKSVALDGAMKSLLLRMTEWHARAGRNTNRRVWEDGRFLEEWADPRVLRDLSSSFAHYDANDMARTLLAMMKLFRWLAIETGERLGFAYPAEADTRVTEWVTAHVPATGD
jgi:aminoglycoside 6-adenylyltransferase